MKTMIPTITVLMPVRNGEKFINEAIESVLAQSYSDFELLIIDDASTDRSRERAQQYSDPRIRIIHNTKPLGLSGVRNKGIKESRGKYIAFLDCDDIAQTDRLKIQMEYFKKHSQIAVVGSWVAVIDDSGVQTGQIWKHATSSEIIPSILLFRSCITQSAVMMKKEYLIKYPFREDYWPSPDYDLWVRLSQECKMANIGKVLTHYRIHTSSMSRDKAQEILECTRRIMKENMKRLNIFVDESDLDTHQMLEPGRCNYKNEEIMRIENWLLKLHIQNKETRLYRIDLFDHLISDYWFKICIANGCSGFSAWRRYERSDLCGLSRWNFKKALIFFIYCLLHRSRTIDITSENWIHLISDGI